MYLYVAVMPSRVYYAEGPQRHSLYAVRIEQAAGERCLIVPYQEFTPALVRDLKPRAVVMSGFGPRFEDLDVRDFYGMEAVMKAGTPPVLCICGSHQLAGYCFNQDIRTVPGLKDLPMRKLEPGDPLPRQALGTDPGGLQKAAHFMASGFYEIEKLRDDPLFEGLPGRMILRCSHYCEVKALPPGFDCLARSGHCAIEAMKHRELPLYGVQFHPEQYEAPFLHGQKVLENFAKVASSLHMRRRRAPPSV
jgi:GMP synthase-like glutamine amidotransferase